MKYASAKLRWLMNYETFVQSHSVAILKLSFATTTRARGMDANVVLMLKIPIELQRDYSGGLLLQIT